MQIALIIFSIANTNITITDNGLDAADVGILNIRAGSFTNTGVLQANDLNLNVNGNFDYTQGRGIINATIFNLEVGFLVTLYAIKRRKHWFCLGRTKRCSNISLYITSV